MRYNAKQKNNPKFMLILILVILLSSFGVIKSFDIPQGEIKNNLYTYKINKDVDYRVYLYDNNFITQDYMKKDEIYITELVDYIQADLDYNYSSSKMGNMDYTYDIIATIYIDYSSISSEKGTHLWSKEYELVKNKNKAVDNSNKINIKESVKIDYSEYNKEVTKFREKFNFPLNAYLDVNFIIKTSANIGQEVEDIVETSTIKLNMNLNEQVFTISSQKTGNEQKTLYETGKEVGEVNKPLLIVSTIILVIGLVILIVKIKQYIRANRKTEYELQLSKILKNYGDIVAEIVNPIETSYMKIIDVKNFDQLLDIEEEIRMPILFCELKKGEEGLFTIIHDNIVYRYVLKERKRNRLY